MKMRYFVQVFFTIFALGVVSNGLWAEYQMHIPIDEDREYYPHNFSAEDLQKTKTDLDRRQLIIELIYAYRYNYSSSIKFLLHKLEAIDPQGAEFQYFSALYEYRQKNYGKAMSLVNKSLEVYPQYSRAWNLKGLLSSEANDNQNAFLYFAKAVEFSPFNPTYSYNKAFLHYKLKDHENAQKMIKLTLKAKSNYAEGYYLQALIDRDRGLIHKSLKEFGKAEYFGYKGSEFYLQFAQVALQTKDLNAQYELVDDLLAIRSMSSYEALAQFYFNFGEYQKALPLLYKVSKSDISSPEIRKKYVQCLARLAPNQIKRIQVLEVSDDERTDLEKVYKQQLADNKLSLEVRDEVLNPIR